MPGDPESGAEKRSCESLLQAALEGNLAELQRLFAISPGDLDLPDRDGCTPLQRASGAGAADVVRFLLDHGAVPGATDGFGTTPLHRAAEAGSLESVEELLKRGVPPGIANRFGNTPLHRAAEAGHLKVVDLLLSSGADQKAVDRFGDTPLHEAAEAGQAAIIRRFLDVGGAVDVVGHFGGTPLHAAAGAGNLRCVELLLEAKAIVDALDEQGGTSLHRASRFGHLGVVQVLLAAGANLETRDRSGRSALDVAWCSGQSEVSEFLFKKGASLEGLSGEELASLKRRLFGGKEPPVGEKRGTLAVSPANQGETQTTSKAPKKRSAKAKRQTTASVAEESPNRERTPFTDRRSVREEPEVKNSDEDAEAALCRELTTWPDEHPSLGAWLTGLAENFTVGVLRLFGGGRESKIHDAVRLGDARVVERLLRRQPQLVHESDEAFLDETPLHCAARYGKTAVAELLIDAGAKIDARNSNGVTPLHKAAFWGYLELCDLLLERGADPGLTDREGETAIEKAQRKSHSAIVKLLRGRMNS